jgi:hypothetical protein
MANSTIATDVHEPLDIHGDLAAERALDLEPGLDLPTEPIHIVVGEVLRPGVEIDSSRLEDLLRS